MTADKEWTKLSAYQHARLRNEMYFGAREPQTATLLTYTDAGPTPTTLTWVPALATAFREILDNALDEIVTHGHGSTLTVTYDPETLAFSVTDDGRGIPIDFDEKEGKHAATVLLSETMAGRNFIAERSDARGLNGVGAAIVNFCSDTFAVEITRGGTRFQQTFRGADELVIEPPVLTPCDPGLHGTTVRVQLSREVFPHALLPEPFVAARMAEVALCYPNLTVLYNGAQVAPSAPPGLFGERPVIVLPIEDAGFQATYWLVPDFQPADAGLHCHSLVNAIPTLNGGVHMDGFLRPFTAGVLSALEKESKRRKLTPNKADVEAGLLVYAIVRMDGAQFDSQSKSRLINDSVTRSLRTALAPTSRLFPKLIRDHRPWIEAIYERAAQRTAKRAPSASALAKSLKGHVEDLEDASANDRRTCTLFLTEGKSAIAGMIEARDPEIHGGLPLRGKVMNVYGASPEQVLANEALAKIMSAIGLIPGQPVNRHKLLYGQVFITTDADEDGKNIAALLVNFFYRFWPKLFDPHLPPFLSIFETPLIIATKGKQRRYWYSDDYDRFDPAALSGWEITRAKGLAALRREDWRHVLAAPRLRPVQDDGTLKDTLDLLFDPARADARKSWIGL